MEPITKELYEIQNEVLKYVTEYNLDPYKVIFHLVDFEGMNEVASFDGFPVRYNHWRFGMAYERLSKTYRYGLSKIYELVVNLNPAQAYLMKSNSLTCQKLVMAHVYAHSDFFKNNMWFSKTDRDMDYVFEAHAKRIKKYYEKYGESKVEEFIDRVCSLENLIDYHSMFYPTIRTKTTPEDIAIKSKKLISKRDYLDEFINPPELLEKEVEEAKAKMEAQKKKFPAEPQKDVLAFLMTNAPLEAWQEDIISIIRDEAYYFAPQILTKIMNEGWASYWHSKILTEKLLGDSEIIEFADHHSGTLAWYPGSGINPYKLGMELFKDIENRWNKGMFGKEYEECNDLEKRRNWDKKTNLGLKKIFEVRKIYNDITFLDEFLTEDFCREHKLFVYKYDPEDNTYKVTSTDFKKVKQTLIFRLTNLGNPEIYVVDGNYKNRGELYLKHNFTGVELDLPEAMRTMQNLYFIWTRPVNLETVIRGERKIITFDGNELSEKVIS